MMDTRIIRPEIGQHYNLVQPQGEWDLSIVNTTPSPALGYPDSLIYFKMEIRNVGSQPSINVQCQAKVTSDSQIVFQDGP